MKKYIYQKFMLQCPYEKISLDNISSYNIYTDFIFSYKVHETLFDYNNTIVRKVDFIDLYEIIDTEEDWNAFIKEIEYVDSLVFYMPDKIKTNQQIANYCIATVKAFIYRIKQIYDDIIIYYDYSNNSIRKGSSQICWF